MWVCSSTPGCGTAVFIENISCLEWTRTVQTCAVWGSTVIADELLIQNPAVALSLNSVVLPLNIHFYWHCASNNTKPFMWVAGTLLYNLGGGSILILQKKTVPERLKWSAPGWTENAWSEFKSRQPHLESCNVLDAGASQALLNYYLLIRGKYITCQ